MAVNLSKIRQLVEQIQAELSLADPGGKARNPLPEGVETVKSPPPGYEAGIVKIVKFETSDKDGKQYLSLALSIENDQPLRWINVYNEQLQERVHAVQKNTRVSFQTKPGVGGKPGRIVTDIFVS